MAGSEIVKCDVCGKSFGSGKHLKQHQRDLHEIVDRNAKKPALGVLKRSKKPVIIGVGIATAVIVSLGVYTAIAPQGSSPLAIDGVQCNAFEQLLFHVHAHLDVIINGRYFVVPSQIGIIPNKCFFWLHTHDESGIIHIESPANKEFTLGQFFDIWGKKFSNSQIFEKAVNGTKNNLNVYVNGNKVPNGVNYRDIQLHPHDEIAIVYGTLPSSIPSNYNFPEGL